MAKHIGVRRQPKIGVHKGMGFQAAAQSVASREGMPMERAEAVIAAGARNASAAAKKRNKNLSKVKG